MKIRYNVVLVIVLITSFLLLASCDRLFGVSIAGAHNPHIINLELNSNSTKLVPVTRPIGQCRAANRENGCFVVPHNETATITFKLHASKKWHITELRICQGIEKPDVCSLEDWQQREFGAFLKTGDTKTRPDSTGLVKMSSLTTKNIKSFKLADYNGVPQNYFYAIKACPDTGKEEDCISTDPAIENQGRN